jgi:hypothetical protein
MVPASKLHFGSMFEQQAVVALRGEIHRQHALSEEPLAEVAPGVLERFARSRPDTEAAYVEFALELTGREIDGERRIVRDLDVFRQLDTPRQRVFRGARRQVNQHPTDSANEPEATRDLHSLFPFSSDARV